MTDFQNERARVAELETLLRQGKVEESVALGSELIEEYPDSFLIRLHLARALKENGALLRAETVLSALDNRYGDNITFLIERGDLRRRLGRPDEAIQDYQKILFLDPFNNKVKSILEEIESERKTQQNTAFEEVVDYRSPAFRDDQTVPEMVLKPEAEEEIISYEPVIDLDAEPENESFFHPVSSLEEEEEQEADSFQMDEEPPQETSVAGHEMGFVTESAARLYAQQGLYKEALSIYEQLNQMSEDEKYLRQIDTLKSRIASERQLEYFKKFLSHFTSDRGSYFV